MLLSLKIILWLIPVLSGVRLQKSNNLHRSRGKKRFAFKNSKNNKRIQTNLLTFLEPIGMMTSVVKVAGLKTV